MGKKDQIDRFTGSHFHTWQTRMRFLLQKKDLWKLVTTSDENIPISREGKAQWDACNTKALAIMALSLGDEYLHHISSAATTKIAWETLDKLFGATGKNAKINLKLQLYKMNMNPGGDFPIHLNSFKSLLGQLGSIKAPLDEDDSIALLLKSLPEEYENIVTTLLNMPSLTLNDVESSLMDEYNNKKGKFLNENIDNAYFTKFKSKAGFKKKDYKACGFCGKTNHKEEDCFHRKKAQKVYLASINKEEEEEEASQEANLASQEAAHLVYEDEWAI